MHLSILPGFYIVDGNYAGVAAGIDYLQPVFDLAGVYYYHPWALPYFDAM